jgi:hypothetical protein
MPEFLINLPPAAQAALVASLVTLFGGVLSAAIGLWGVTKTNKAHEQRLRAQFEKDDERKRVEREMDLRKSVYLEVSEAIQAGLLMISRYPDVNISQEELTAELNSKRYGFAKANLIAKPALLEKLMKFNTELAACVLKLSLNRQNLINIKDRLDSINSEINKHLAERESALSTVKATQLNGNQNQSQIEALNRIFNWTQTEIDRLTAEQRELQAIYRSKWLDLVKQSRNATASLNVLLAPLVSAARVELEIPIDEKSYANAINGAVAEQEKNLNEFLLQLSPMNANQNVQNG